MDDHVNRLLRNVARAVMECSGAKQLSLLGYSMGGTLALCYTALYPEQVKNLILLGTPVDFEDAGLMGAWSDKRYFDVDRLVATFGNVPAEMLRRSFFMLKPVTNFTKFLNALEHLRDEEAWRNFLAVELWINDSIPIPGEFYRTFVKDFYQDNLLAKGELKIGGRAVDLSRVRCPVLNCIGTKDQNVPPASSMRLKDLISSTDQEELLLPYGHIMLSVSAHAEKDLWAKSAAWLKQRSGNGKRRETRDGAKRRTRRKS